MNSAALNTSAKSVHTMPATEKHRPRFGGVILTTDGLSVVNPLSGIHRRTSASEGSAVDDLICGEVQLAPAFRNFTEGQKPCDEPLHIGRGQSVSESVRRAARDLEASINTLNPHQIKKNVLTLLDVLKGFMAENWRKANLDARTLENYRAVIEHTDPNQFLPRNASGAIDPTGKVQIDFNA